MKRIISLVLVIVLVACGIPFSASAASQYGTDLNGTNETMNNYSTYGYPIYSYMTVRSNGNLMTVTCDFDGVEVAYYSSQYRLLKTLTLAEELPLFGGFYETEDGFYILTGQNNHNEDPTVEVFRVTKYNKEWKRIGSVGLYDCNTTVPFDAGSARFAHDGTVLVIRTCHEMYQSSDGLNHQANLTFSIDTAKMKLIESVHGVSNIGDGYVSHSFNQFIKYVDGQFVAVDHGDAYPRSVCLVKYKPTMFKQPSTFLWYFIEDDAKMLSIPGAIGDNYTGVSVGGFEASPTSYLVVGNSELYKANVRNIFVSVLPKDGDAATVKYLTEYEGGASSASTPHLVKITDNAYLVLWSVGEYVYYRAINGVGEPRSALRKMKGALSDCAPIAHGGKVQWYTYNNNDVTFYSISTSDLGKTTKKTVNNGHKYVMRGNSTHHWRKCTDCGLIVDKEQHSSTSKNTHTTFDNKGMLVLACKTCRYAFKSDTLKIQLKETIASDGEQTLIPIVKTASGKTLKEGTDYFCWEGQWSYIYTNSGKTKRIRSTMFFSKDNSYENGFERQFTSLSYFGAVGSIKNQVYTAKAVKPAVKVTCDGKTLKNGTDYTVTYTNNVKIGTATATITGIGSYFGTLKKTFKIVKNITSAKVTGIVTKGYTGKAITQSPKVVLNGKTLKKGTDYTVSYKNNVKTGKATMTITGKGSYAGTITKTFNIVPRKIANCSVKLSTTSYTYNGKVRAPAVTVRYAGKTLKKGTDYTVTYAKGRKNVGTYKVTVKMKGNFSGTKTLTFKIKPAKTTVSKLTAGKKSLTVSITKKTAQVTGYQIQYSTSKTFSKATTKTISSYKTTKYTLKNLSAKKTYYVRVRTYKTVGKTKYYSAWSTYKYKKTK